ncbi:uncharacterized protein EAF02_002014 [Botrytis sinoallii]|uniref:uncharacterized protein n=1 Tax=Botrytis sinoallii TaxID=1463999 RepID=UPI0019001615|nr:uncharacterized protein EAF02_002014 [Botrytis sinoallii]KAF7889599.1 hypothetical protein EAF02_002014 [Botrytis sinoallii]
MVRSLVPSALALDMTALKATLEKLRKLYQRCIYVCIYHCRYHLGNCAASSHDSTELNELETLIFLKYKTKLQISSRSTSISVALCSSAVTSSCTSIIVNLMVINSCVDLYLAITRRSVKEEKMKSIAV